MNKPKFNRGATDPRIAKAIALFNKAEHEKTRQLLEQILSESPGNVDALLLLGKLFLATGQTAQAIDHLYHAASLLPDNMHIRVVLGGALVNAKAAPQAIELFQDALRVEPQDVFALGELGRACNVIGHYQEAKDALKKAVALDPKNSSLHAELSGALRGLLDFQGALEHGQRAVSLNPRDTAARFSLAGILGELGRTDEAYDHYLAAIDIAPTIGHYWAGLSQYKKLRSEEDRSLLVKAEKVLDGKLAAPARASIHFALGKWNDDLGDWNTAFDHYRKGNLLRKKSHEYEALKRQLHKMLGAANKVYTKRLFEKHHGVGSNSEKPIFVLGMPRSGTTLVENVISRHPAVYGAGELMHIGSDIVRDLSGDNTIGLFRQEIEREPKKGKPYPFCVPLIGSDTLALYARWYLDAIDQIDAGSQRLVDKMPSNFYHIGLIHLLFPRSTIIHIQRHPLDTCLSCYFQSFNDERMVWAFELDWIANYYCMYRSYMEYWEQVLPGRVLNVRYEDLVQDPDLQIRRIVEHCRLPWAPECLESSADERQVRTASVWQVRQPIYATSKYRWQRYATHLEGLATLLEGYLTEEDRKVFREFDIEINRRRWFGRR